MAYAKFRPVIDNGAVSVLFPQWRMPKDAFIVRPELGHGDGLHPTIPLTDDVLNQVEVVIEIPDIFLDDKGTKIDFRKVRKMYRGVEVFQDLDELVSKYIGVVQKGRP